MIQPTVGRVVWYWPEGPKVGENPWAAFVTHVHGDRMINVAGFTDVGTPFFRNSVSLLQDDDKATGGFCASWMPYQKGQAAKTEALEKELSKEDAR